MSEPEYATEAVGAYAVVGGEAAEHSFDSGFLGRLQRRHHEPQLDRQQLDVEKINPDVTRNDDARVEHPLQGVAQVGRLRAGLG
jgi:hypothetical protein